MNYQRVQEKCRIHNLPIPTHEQIDQWVEEDNRKWRGKLLVFFGFLFTVGCYIYSSDHGIHLEIP